MTIEIVEFEDGHAGAFKALNEIWIAKHFTVEAKDREVLDDPKGKIIAKGGRVFMALDEGQPVGCVALIAMDDGGFEVAKMTVSETVRGTGLGRALMDRCIEAGREAGAPRLYLETNSSLAPARALYLAAGFKDLPPAPTPYARCDTWMELRL
jgi:putative acetyltransferase